MLNKKGQRELAYVVAIDKIIPIEGANSVEQAVVGRLAYYGKKRPI